MARIRTVKPEFWTSEQVAECSPNARLLFIGMWNFCDDAGVHPASVRRLKMQIYPGDSFGSEEIADMVEELKVNQLIHEYEVGNEVFWLISGFRKHQKIDKPTYRFPLPNDEIPESANGVNLPTTRRPLAEGSPSDHPRKGMESRGMESKGMEGAALGPPSAKDEPESKAKSRVPPIPYDEILEAFNGTFSLRVSWTDSRRNALKARWCDQWWRQNWRSMLERAGPSTFLRGANDRNWVVTLEYFLRPDTLTKISEGAHDNRKPTGNQASAADRREAANASGFDRIRAAAAAASGSESCEPAAGH